MTDRAMLDELQGAKDRLSDLENYLPWAGLGPLGIVRPRSIGECSKVRPTGYEYTTRSFQKAYVHSIVSIDEDQQVSVAPNYPSIGPTALPTARHLK